MYCKQATMSCCLRKAPCVTAPAECKCCHILESHIFLTNRVLLQQSCQESDSSHRAQICEGQSEKVLPGIHPCSSPANSTLPTHQIRHGQRCIRKVDHRRIRMLPGPRIRECSCRTLCTHSEALIWTASLIPHWAAKEVLDKLTPRSALE